MVSFLTLLLGVFSNVSANGLSGWIHRYIGCISLTCVSGVNYEMISQMAYLMGCIVTLVALVGILSVMVYLY